MLHDFKHYCSAVTAALSKWQHCGRGTVAVALRRRQHCGGSSTAAAAVLGRQPCGGSKLTLKNYERLSTKERDNSKRTRQQQKNETTAKVHQQQGDVPKTGASSRSKTELNAVHSKLTLKNICSCRLANLCQTWKS